MIDERTNIFLMMAALICIIASYFVLQPLPDQISGIRKRNFESKEVRPSESLTVINRALLAVPAKDTFVYRGGFENPFRQWNNALLSSDSKSPKKPPRNMLILKGILMKDRPLAILENQTGETFIRGEGEKALDQTVVSISKNHVIIRDHLGSYELSVKEQ